MKIKKIVEKVLFASKWLLIPFYIGLMFALVVYMFLDIKEVLHLCSDFNSLKEEDGMLILLKLVDITMIANLVKMIITGSYTSFVDKYHSETGEKTSSGLLKVKMSTSLIGVSSIHLLQTFIDAKNVPTEVLNKQLIIHGSFLIGSLMLAIIDYLHVKSEAIEHGLLEHKKESEHKH